MSFYISIPWRKPRDKSSANFRHEPDTISPPYPFHRHRRWGATVKTSQDIQSGFHSGCCIWVLRLRRSKKIRTPRVTSPLAGQAADRVPTSLIEPRSGSIGNGRQRSPLLCRPCWLQVPYPPEGFSTNKPAGMLALSHQTLPKRAAARVVLSTKRPIERHRLHKKTATKFLAAVSCRRISNDA